MASLVTKKDVWYAVFSLHHHQKWIRLGRGSKTLAKKALRKLEEEFEEDQKSTQQLPKRYNQLQTLTTRIQ